jgi:hypothetical protein
VTFYDEVLRELLVALGAALFFGNVYALLRRRADAQRVASESATRSRASKRGPKPVPRSVATRQPAGELAQAPVLRTAVYVALGFVMMVAGIAALAAG